MQMVNLHSILLRPPISPPASQITITTIRRSARTRLPSGLMVRSSDSSFIGAYIPSPHGPSQVRSMRNGEDAPYFPELLIIRFIRYNFWLHSPANESSAVWKHHKQVRAFSRWSYVLPKPGIVRSGEKTLCTTTSSLFSRRSTGTRRSSSNLLLILERSTTYALMNPPVVDKRIKCLDAGFYD